MRYIKSGSKDDFSKKKLGDTSIHSVIQVKIKPIFNFDILEKICTFDVHQDVILNEVII